MSWQTVVRRPGGGEQVLFKVGLLIFLATPAETGGHFALLETVLPPGAAVEAHQHPEAECWYVLAGEFRFTFGDPGEGVAAGPGTLLSVPPHLCHAYEHLGPGAGRLLGMLLSGRDGGLEAFFRQVGVPVRTAADILDLRQPVAHL
jgi:quercetin dioxygenase-like cupin family protein